MSAIFIAEEVSPLTAEAAPAPTQQDAETQISGGRTAGVRVVLTQTSAYELSAMHMPRFGIPGDASVTGLNAPLQDEVTAAEVEYSRRSGPLEFPQGMSQEERSNEARVALLARRFVEKRLSPEEEARLEILTSEVDALLRRDRLATLELAAEHLQRAEALERSDAELRQRLRRGR
jgi:hypothetical protein